MREAFEQFQTYSGSEARRCRQLGILRQSSEARLDRVWRNPVGPTDLSGAATRGVAKAHIAVQRWIDEANLRGRVTTREGIREIHRRFCGELPNELLWAESPDTHERLPVVPGEFRLNDVKVGQHQTIA